VSVPHERLSDAGCLASLSRGCSALFSNRQVGGSGTSDPRQRSGSMVAPRSHCGAPSEVDPIGDTWLRHYCLATRPTTSTRVFIAQVIALRDGASGSSQDVRYSDHGDP